MQKTDPIISSASKIVYEAASAAAVSDRFIESLPWPAAVPRLGLLFKDTTAGAEAFAGSVSERYSCTLVYFAGRDALPVPEIEPAGNISAERVESKKDLVDLYVSNQEEHFYKRWPGHVSPDQLAGTRAFAEKYLLPELSLSLSKGGVRVGFATLVKWKDWFDAPVNLVSWVWFDGALSGKDRAEAHAKFLSWLKDSSPGELCCSVDSFNLRSQRFFKTLGFRLKCILITRNFPV